MNVYKVTYQIDDKLYETDVEAYTRQGAHHTFYDTTCKGVIVRVDELEGYGQETLSREDKNYYLDRDNK